MADSNVLMPPDYLQRLLAPWRPGVGLVASPPVGCRPEGLAAELECAFLNAHQARWQILADTAGHGFAQGKTMLWRREILEAAGGIEALAAEPAEDAAATKIVRALGLTVRLVDAPFRQPLGRRSLAAVWRRQMRWARLRRQTFPAQFALEILAGGLPPLLAAGLAAALLDLPAMPIAAALAVAWYGAETVLARRAGWPSPAAAPILFLLRDAMLPALWIAGIAGRGIAWRGHVVVPGKPALSEGRA